MPHTRHYHDASRVIWHVWGQGCHALPHPPASRCLVGASESVVRRVWRFPADWPDLSDAELEALSWTV